MERERTPHAVYQITYHFVWCPKYRRAVLEGPLADRLIVLLHELVPALDGDLLELVVRPDHVHLFAHFPPALAPAQILHRLKGATSHTLRREYPALRSRLPSLWTSSYYVGTAGVVSSATIRRYIEAQKGQCCLRKAFVYRRYPPDVQTLAMQGQLALAGALYNACLEERREAYKRAGTTLGSYDQAHQLKAIRALRPAMTLVNASMLQATCRRVQRSFDAFFRRVKAGEKKPGFPRFRSCRRWDSSTFPRSGDGCKLTERRYLQGIGHSTGKLHRPIEGRYRP
jgi:REP element-mobilizing transposase RayT